MVFLLRYKEKYILLLYCLRLPNLLSSFDGHLDTQEVSFWEATNYKIHDFSQQISEAAKL